MVTVKIMVATAFIVLGNTFLVVFGNHQSPGAETKISCLDSMASSRISTEMNRLVVSSEEPQNKELQSFVKGIMLKAKDVAVKAKTACALSMGSGEDTMHASSVLVMAMMSSRTTGFRGSGIQRAKILSMRSYSWSKIPMDEDPGKMLESSSFPEEAP